jgi:hypothetical protein
MRWWTVDLESDDVPSRHWNQMSRYSAICSTFVYQPRAETNGALLSLKHGPHLEILIEKCGMEERNGLDGIGPFKNRLHDI